MIVIYGTRNVGKVDGRDGEHAVTRFAHIYWLPLFPVSGLWMTERGGHHARLNLRSVIAGYVRTWGVVGTVAFMGTGAIVAGIFTGGAVALSWLWKNVRGDDARRRSDLNLLAFGTRCDPHAMTDDMVDTLRRQVDARWAAVSEGQAPSDVARFGADGGAFTGARRAAAAYGVLRLSALGLPPAQAAEAEADADKIAAGYREDRTLGEAGPYRAQPPAAAAGDATSSSPRSPPPRR